MFAVRSKATVTPDEALQSFVPGFAMASTTPLNVPGVLELLSASAVYVAVVELPVEIPHDTLVLKPLVNQFESFVGSVAWPTVITKVTVEVP